MIFLTSIDFTGDINIDFFSPHQEQFPLSDWIWIAIFIIILVIIWILLIRSTRLSEKEAEEIKVDEGHGETQAAEIAVSKLEVSETSKQDDLTRIEGIGPKINAMLYEAGITTFEQLSNTEISKLDELLDAAGYTFANPNSWPEQAKLASKGEWGQLEELHDKLVGGRTK